MQTKMNKVYMAHSTIINQDSYNKFVILELAKVKRMFNEFKTMKYFTSETDFLECFNTVKDFIVNKIFLKISIKDKSENNSNIVTKQNSFENYNISPLSRSIRKNHLNSKYKYMKFKIGQEIEKKRHHNHNQNHHEYYVYSGKYLFICDNSEFIKCCGNKNSFDNDKLFVQKSFCAVNNIINSKSIFAIVLNDLRYYNYEIFDKLFCAQQGFNFCNLESCLKSFLHMSNFSIDYSFDVKNLICFCAVYCKFDKKCFLKIQKLPNCFMNLQKQELAKLFIDVNKIVCLDLILDVVATNFNMYSSLQLDMFKTPTLGFEIREANFDNNNTTKFFDYLENCSFPTTHVTKIYLLFHSSSLCFKNVFFEKFLFCFLKFCQKRFPLIKCCTIGSKNILDCKHIFEQVLPQENDYKLTTLPFSFKINLLNDCNEPYHVGKVDNFDYIFVDK